VKRRERGRTTTTRTDDDDGTRNQKVSFEQNSKFRNRDVCDETTSSYVI